MITAQEARAEFNSETTAHIEIEIDRAIRSVAQTKNYVLINPSDLNSNLPYWDLCRLVGRLLEASGFYVKGYDSQENLRIEW